VNGCKVAVFTCYPVVCVVLEVVFQVGVIGFEEYMYIGVVLLSAPLATSKGVGLATEVR
jgi:hypothetical protein